MCCGAPLRVWAVCRVSPFSPTPTPAWQQHLNPIHADTTKRLGGGQVTVHCGICLKDTALCRKLEKCFGSCIPLWCCYPKSKVFHHQGLPKNPPLGGFFRFWRLLYAGGSRGSSPRSLKSCAFAHLVSQNLYFIGFTRCGIQLLQHHVAR